MSQKTSILLPSRDVRTKLVQLFPQLKDSVRNYPELEENTDFRFRQNTMRQAVQALCYRMPQNDIIISWATGVGKTRAALLRAFKGHQKGHAFNILIVIKQNVHQMSWEEDIKEHVPEELYSSVNIEYVNYRSLHHLKGQFFNSIILDEAHGVTQLSLRSLIHIGTNSVIALSATLSYDKYTLLIKWRPFVKSTITLPDAWQLGLLPIPRIVITKTRLSTVGKNCWFTVGSRDNPIQEIDFEDLGKPEFMNQKLQLKVWCTEQQYYDRLTSDITRIRNQYMEGGEREQWLKDKFLMLGSMRKNFLGDVKVEPAKVLLELMEGSRHIVFTNTIDQCQKVAGNRPQVHTRTNTNDMDIVKKFNLGKFDSIVAVRVLDESINLKDIDEALLVTLDGNVDRVLQRLGRALRGLEPIFRILYVENTKDYHYLKEFLKHVPKSIIEYEELPNQS